MLAMAPGGVSPPVRSSNRGSRGMIQATSIRSVGDTGCAPPVGQRSALVSLIDLACRPLEAADDLGIRIDRYVRLVLAIVSECI